MSIEMIQAKVEDWAANYKGPKFHALLSDPPYHLTTITKRYGKPDSAPSHFYEDGLYQRMSTGFMGQEWDGGDVAFRKETWEVLWHLLYPGAFGMAFSSARTAHRLTVAIEDAGYIIHPSIYWVYSSGFPKATRIDNQIDNEKLASIWSGFRYGLQALKPAAEPIIVFQKPYDGRSVDNMTETGAGALNIDAARIGTTDHYKGGQTSMPHPMDWGNSSPEGFETEMHPLGRWPANFLLQHHWDCQFVGHASDDYIINRFTDGAKPFGGGAGHDYEESEEESYYEVWKCHPECPCIAMDLQSGFVRKPFEETSGASRYFYQSNWLMEKSDPFIYVQKATTAERDAGLKSQRATASDYRTNDPDENKLQTRLHKSQKRLNPHPTVKPISLAAHLSAMLRPPGEYAPRRIMVPFAGVASEMIGCWQSLWEDVVGIEMNEEYVEIANQRIEHWVTQRGHQIGFDL